MKRLGLGVIALSIMLSFSGCLGGESEKDYIGNWFQIKEANKSYSQAELHLTDNGNCTLSKRNNISKDKCTWSFENKTIILYDKRNNKGLIYFKLDNGILMIAEGDKTFSSESIRKFKK